MKIEYRETTSDLQTRIDIHVKYGGRDIDAWMLDLLKLQPGSRILDIGCGAGKQCFSYHKFLQGQAEIHGGDVTRIVMAGSSAGAHMTATTALAPPSSAEAVPRNLSGAARMRTSPSCPTSAPPRAVVQPAAAIWSVNQSAAVVCA